MKKFSLFVSAVLVTGICFWALVAISTENRYTSVRKYSKPKPDITAPTIEFLNYQNDQVVTEAEIDVQIRVSDNKSPTDQIVVEWSGMRQLELGFNPIVVSAKDAAGNISTAYIIIEKQ